MTQQSHVAWIAHPARPMCVLVPTWEGVDGVVVDGVDHHGREGGGERLEGRDEREELALRVAGHGQREERPQVRVRHLQRQTRQQSEHGMPFES